MTADIAYIASVLLATLGAVLGIIANYRINRKGSGK